MKSQSTRPTFAAVTSALMLIVFAALLTMSFMNNAQDKKTKPWIVPAKDKEVKNPVKSDAASLASGKELYTKYCKSCHGVKGKGDGPKAQEIDTPTSDFTDKTVTAETDGELFYKAKQGRDDMPSFKKKIPDDKDIWAVVNYVRSLGGDK